MAWIGTEQEVMDLLAKVEADRGADGRFIISGEPVVSGLGDEVVVPDATVYFRHGRPFSLARSLEQAGVGFAGLKVFEAGLGYQPNPIPKGERKKLRDRTKRFDRELVKGLGGKETWRLSIRDAMPKYSVVVYVEDCPGAGDMDRARDEVVDAFKASGLDKQLYFDGTDYGPMPGPEATAQDVAKMGCPERGYHFYDASKDHPPGVDLDDPSYRAAAEWERSCIESTTSRAADANPEPERHRAAYNDYVMNARNHILAATPLLQQGRFVEAFGPIRHAECDIRQAYTEAVYAKKNKKDLAKMVQPLEHLFSQLQAQVQMMEAQL